MLTSEERTELKNIAAKLYAEMQSHNKRVNVVINHLLSDADSLALAAADERSADGMPKVKPVRFNAVAEVPSVGEPDAPAGKFRKAEVGRGTGKRACSICRQPGHRKSTCPEADKKYKADRKGKK